MVVGKWGLPLQRYTASRGETLVMPTQAAARHALGRAMLILRRVFNVVSTATACFPLSTVTHAARWSAETQRWAPSRLLTAARDLWSDPSSPVGHVVDRAGLVLLESASERELLVWLDAHCVVRPPVIDILPRASTPPCVWGPCTPPCVAVDAGSPRPLTPSCEFVTSGDEGTHSVAPPGASDTVTVDADRLESETPSVADDDDWASWLADMNPPTPLGEPMTSGNESARSQTPPCVFSTVSEDEGHHGSEAAASHTPSVADDEDWACWLASLH